MSLAPPRGGGRTGEAFDWRSFLCFRETPIGEKFITYPIDHRDQRKVTLFWIYQRMPSPMCKIESERNEISSYFDLDSHF